MAAASKVGAALSNVTKRAAPKSAGAAKAGAAPKVAGPARAGASGKAAPTAARACSFTGATLVLMGDGSKKPIEDVEVGEQVVASDPQTGEQEARTVTHVFVHQDEVVDLALDNGTVLGTTEDHPFWSVTDGRFERADELKPGEHVLAADGRVLTVAGLRGSTSRAALAYNLSVDGIHTYHVGEADVLVHNVCPLAPDSSPSPVQVGPGASLENITAGQATRIQNAANRIGRPVSLVGSRARGAAGPYSDWDYVVAGINSRVRHSVSSSLPRGAAELGYGRQIDIFTGPLQEHLPHITFNPIG